MFEGSEAKEDGNEKESSGGNEIFGVSGVEIWVFPQIVPIAPRIIEYSAQPNERASAI